MPQIKWERLRRWLTEYEIDAVLNHPADSMVDPRVHNEVVRSLLEKLAAERERVAGYERLFEPRKDGFLQ